MAELTKTGESRTLRLIAANSRMGLAAAHRDRVNRHPAGAARSPKSATKWATTTRELPRDPLAEFQRPSSGMPGAATSAWTADEARTFLRSVADDRLRAAWWLLLTRGLRREELLGLRWLDVDLATRERLNRSNPCAGGQYRC